MIRFRLHPAPARPLPLNVRSAGHYHLAPGHREQRTPGAFLQLFWSVSGSGRFASGGGLRPVKPGVVFHYAAGEPHDLRAGPEGWEYRWLTLDGPRYDRLVRDHALARARSAGPCPAALFDQLDTALRDPTSGGELRASVLAYEILLRAGPGRRAEPAADDAPAPAAAEAKAWLDAHFTDPRLNVAALASRLRLHRASLHRVFTRHYGVPPVRYLARLRLRLALELLTATRLPVADVAVRCGLPDLAYFSKLISRHTGHGPRDYRWRHAALLMTKS